MRGPLGLAGTFLVCALLAACGDDVGWGDASPESVSARFEGLSDVIVVNATDSMPLRSAVLVAPDGERVAAYSLDVTASPTVDDPSLGATLLMNNPGVPRSVTRLDTIASTALIRLPDPNRYGKTWQDSRIELGFGDPGSGERHTTLPAPKPPA